ncbi:type I restriction enzyme HsdR N-terminal domain-containing protein [Deinococcus yunweiensis]|uniref:type I restriction enzyme HsdR N-terminal domain-containing protein n=1 Tax=Deinococcus yunweiensis TaxID=367282 RepID=UPI00398F1E7B
MTHDPWARIQAVVTGSEGDVEQRVVLPLLEALGWAAETIKGKDKIQLTIGRPKKGGSWGFADFVVKDPQTEAAFIVVEAKAPGEPLAPAVAQADTYARNINAPYLLVTNGSELQVLRRSVRRPPESLISISVADAVTHQAFLATVLSPAVLRAEWVQAELEVAPLSDLDLPTGTEGLLIQRRRRVISDFLRQFGAEGIQVAEQAVEIQSPWRDQFDQARTLEALLDVLGNLGAPLSVGQMDALAQNVIALDPQEAQRLSVGLAITAHRATQPVPDSDHSRRKRTLDAGDQGYGPESVVLAEIGIPMLLPWTQTVDQLFSGFTQEAMDSFVDWYEQGIPDAAPLERVVWHAVRGEARKAYQLLEESRPDDTWSVERQIARARLLATLSREQGDSVRAQDHYDHARSLLRSQSRQERSVWLVRRLMLDQNSVDSSADFNAVLERHDAMLGVRAWYSHPVIDQLIHSMTNDVTQEAFALHQDRPTSSRTSTLLFGAWRTYVQARIFAYASGDHYALHNLQVTWARLLLTLPRPPLDDVLETLWNSREDTLLAQVIEQDPRQALKDWPELDTKLLERPLRPGSVDAQKRHLCILRVIPLLAPYLREDTVQTLQAELVQGFVLHGERSRGVTRRSEYEPVPLIEGRHYSITYAVDALVALSHQQPLSEKQVQALALSVQDTPFSRFSAWEVLQHHQWRASDIDVALDLLPRLQPHLEQWDQERQLDFQRRLTKAYPEESRFLTHWLSWLLPSADAPQITMSPAARWHHLLLNVPPEPAVESWIRQNAFAYFQEVTQRLVRTTGRESRAIGLSHPVRYLPEVVRRYPSALTSDQVQALLNDVLLAVSNPHLPIDHKADLFVALEQLSEVARDRVAMPEWAG